MTTPELKACGVLIVQGDPIQSFLLMRHDDRWDLPKGHVDGNESDRECALRELEEETGLTTAEVSLDPHFRFTSQYYVQYARTSDQRRLKELVIFLGRVKDQPEIHVTEHAGFSWFDWNPPHVIQENTINPLLAALELFLETP